MLDESPEILSEYYNSMCVRRLDESESVLTHFGCHLRGIINYSPLFTCFHTKTQILQ